ncbi:MAG: hypothetical protein HQM15_05850 [Deltaproteobacteria bacterium]|nr:hypothetical protein [Deltaproteobacteria bacterium]
MTQDLNSSKETESQIHTTDSFALYLAKLFIAKKGYSMTCVPEAEALAASCDYVLTLADGMSFSMICIVDAEKNPSRRFELERNQLIEISKVCRENYSGRISASKLPAQIEIIEVRKQVSPEDIKRLKLLQKRLSTPILTYAIAIDAPQTDFFKQADFSPRWPPKIPQ